MKFSHSLHLNSNPEWHDKYISYSNLKKLIYRMERAHVVGIPVYHSLTSSNPNVNTGIPGNTGNTGNVPSILDLQQYLHESALNEEKSNSHKAFKKGKSNSLIEECEDDDNHEDLFNRDDDNDIIQTLKKKNYKSFNNNENNNDDDFDDDLDDDNNNNDINININDGYNKDTKDLKNIHKLSVRGRAESENSSVYLHSRSNTEINPNNNNNNNIHLDSTLNNKENFHINMNSINENHDINKEASYFSKDDPFDTTAGWHTNNNNDFDYNHNSNNDNIRSLLSSDIPEGIHLPIQDSQASDLTILGNDNAKVDIGTCITVFTESLDKEVYRTTQFYIQQEAKLLSRYDQLVKKIKDIEFEFTVSHCHDTSLLHPFPLLQIMEDDLPNHPNSNAIDINQSDNRPGIYSQSVGSYDQSIGIKLYSSSMYSEEDTQSLQSEYSSSRSKPNVSSTRLPYNNNRESLTKKKITRSNTDSYFPAKIWLSKEMKSKKIEISKKLSQLFVKLIELKDYSDMNYTGFSKILKKFDKVMGTSIKNDYLEQRVDEAEPYIFETKERIEKAQNRVIQIYSRLNYEGKFNIASTALRHNLREHIVWERNTIWRDMIDKERKTETIDVITRGIKNKPFDRKTKLIIRLSKDEDPVFAIALYNIFGKKVWLPYMNKLLTLWTICITTFLSLLLLDLSSIFKEGEQQRCFAILVLASMLWATELLPLFITSTLIPGLVVLLRVLRKETLIGQSTIVYKPLNAKESAKQIFSDMFGPVIMLLLGGFSLASVLSKYNIAKQLAGVILEKVGSNPNNVILANMLVSTFLSMWISNVATPVLCFSLIQPILRVLPSKSQYGKCLILGIALAANVGGMASPIASPQNVIAISNMSPAPSWFEWFAVSIPTVLIIDVLVWLLLLAIFKPSESVKDYMPIAANNNDNDIPIKSETIYSVNEHIPNVNTNGKKNSMGTPLSSGLNSPGISQLNRRDSSNQRSTFTANNLLNVTNSNNNSGYDPDTKQGSYFPPIEPPELFNKRKSRYTTLTNDQLFIIAVTILTIFLWCIESKFDYIFGDMGVIAILPIIVFYGCGYLTKDDWNSMLWSVVMLAMGGIALGKAVQSSGLLQEITGYITPLVKDLSVFYCLLVFSFITLVITTFISHTVGALILLPIILEIGKQLDDPRPSTLVMASAFMCSGGMGLPVSSFPNMNAISQEDHRGKPWLEVKDFLIAGIPASIITWIVVNTVGYGLMASIGIQ